MLESDGPLAVVRAIEEAAGDVLSPGVGSWPVVTGASKRGLKVKSTIARGVAIVRIVGEAGHTYYVRPKGLFGKTAWQEYVAKPAKKAARRVAKAGAAAIVAASKGG